MFERRGTLGRMLIPDHWFEAHRRVESPDGRVRTFYRWGWSVDEPDAAERHAEERLDRAEQRFLAGGEVPSRIAKSTYGVEGTPIREEVIGRFDRHVLTRNTYGATCLNTPDGFFADIDVEDCFGLFFGAAVLVGLGTASIIAFNGFGIPLEPGLIFFLAVIPCLVVAVVIAAIVERLFGNSVDRSRRRIESFLDDHPDWTVRLYKSPNGWRTLVTHRPISSEEPEVGEMFDAIGADPRYVALCRRQKCFRARLTGKPWRMGIEEPLRPRGVWPVDPEDEDERDDWIESYEKLARRYAACRLVEVYHPAPVHPDLQRLVRMHDQLCNAETDLPLA